MEEWITQYGGQLGQSIVFLIMAVKMFQFFVDAVTDFRKHLVARVAYLEEENKQLRQALFATKDPDAMRMATALLARSAPTEIEP